MVGGKSPGERVFHISNICDHDFPDVCDHLSVLVCGHQLLERGDGSDAGAFISLAPAVYMGQLADRYGGSRTASGGMDHRVADGYRYGGFHPVHGDVRLRLLTAVLKRKEVLCGHRIYQHVY